jgi:hypothetical protein
MAVSSSESPSRLTISLRGRKTRSKAQNSTSTAVRTESTQRVAMVRPKIDPSNYFRIGAVSKAYRAIDQHTADRLRRWLCRKHKVQGADDTLPVSIPVRGAEIGSARRAAAQRHVGESVRSCPKAGCGRTARPV